MDSAWEAKWLTEALREHFDNRGVAVEDLRVRPFTVAGSILSKIYLAEGTEADSGQHMSLVCKLQEDEPTRTNLYLSMHFHNESLFFAELLPFLLGPVSGQDNVSLLFPLFRLAHRDDLQWLIVMDDLTPLGYKNVHRTLDLRHATLALQALGRFHALSYAAKRTQPAQFHSLMGCLQYPRKRTSMGRMLEIVNLNCVHHTARLFQEYYPQEYVMYSEKLEEIILDASDLYGKVLEGEEPLAVLCHGDFKKENVLFSYDVEGNPTTVKLIDFQLLSYSSPAIDVFLLLFMSTAPEIWETFWNTLFSSYHEALLETVSRYLKCSMESLQEELGAEMFKTEFKKYCHHGFYISNFFNPIQNLEPSQKAIFIKTIIEDGTYLEKINPLLANFNRSYGNEMKQYVMTMLLQVLKFKTLS